MTRIRYRNLTAAQKAHICNGCGGKGSIIPIPDFIFKADCNHHDFNYFLGCTEAQRKKADKQFLTEMLKDAVKSIKPYEPKTPKKLVFLYEFMQINERLRILHEIRNQILIIRFKFWAYAFYTAVRLMGKKYFYYAPKQRTLEDLNDQIKGR